MDRLPFGVGNRIKEIGIGVMGSKMDCLRIPTRKAVLLLQRDIHGFHYRGRPRITSD